VIAPLLAAVAAALAPPPLPALPPAAGVTVPPGYRAEVYARNLNRITALAWGPGGRLYATVNDQGSIVSVTRGSTRPRTVVVGLKGPLGLVWRGSNVYVSETGMVRRFTVRSGRVTASRVLVSGLPNGRHQQDNILFGRDGRLYFGSGSTCDVCHEKDVRSATVLSMRPDGSDLRVVSGGLRNPFGLVRDPSGRLLASVNGQDELGTASDPEPAEMIVSLSRGRNFGWPDCWPSFREQRMVGSCAGVTPPLAYLEPHSSADGMAFWRGSLYVAEWGQYCCHTFGRKVVRVDLRRNPGTVTTFVTGIEHPLALAVDPQNGLLVGDYETGTVFRISRR
jgi:glucose/arabinose dehydrogenase